MRHLWYNIDRKNDGGRYPTSRGRNEMGHYAIAYANKDGTDFHGYPWIEDGFATLQGATKRRDDLKASGYHRLFVFVLPEDHDELVSWEYVESHQIKE